MSPLGGPDAADRALRALMRELERLAKLQDGVRWLPVANTGPVDGTLGVVASAVELSGIARDTAAIYGNGESKTDCRESNGQNTRMEVENGSIRYSKSGVTTINGLLGRFSTLMKVNVCPDAGGKVTVDITSQSNISRVNGSAGANTTVRVTITRYVTDDAEYEDIDESTHVEAAAYGPGSASFVDLDVDKSSRKGGATRDTVSRRSKRTSDEDVSNARTLSDGASNPRRHTASWRRRAAVLMACR
jgi:hypothetical protein